MFAVVGGHGSEVKCFACHHCGVRIHGVHEINLRISQLADSRYDFHALEMQRLLLSVRLPAIEDENELLAFRTDYGTVRQSRDLLLARMYQSGDVHSGNQPVGVASGNLGMYGDGLGLRVHGASGSPKTPCL